MANALHLPIVFCCENNEYGEFTPREKTMAITDIADRAIGYGMPGVIVDGMDAEAVYEVASEAVARARAGDGPTFIEAKTYRFFNHHGIQNLGLKYRPDDEVARWKLRDPIDLIEGRVVTREVATKDDLELVWETQRADLAAAIEFAEASPPPSVDELLTDVYTVMGTR
jgi:acetoin:2,6-dichlorophenolindophenol oxidoreductase subunit alpha